MEIGRAVTLLRRKCALSRQWLDSDGNLVTARLLGEGPEARYSVSMPLLCATFAWCAVLVLPGHGDNPESFSYLKELALFSVTAVVGVIELSGRRRFHLDNLDLLVGSLCIATILSATLVAENKYFALRAGGVTVCACIVFVIARSSIARRDQVAFAVACAVTAVAIIGMLQIYLSWPSFNFHGPPPGSTFGNRNRAAHFVAAGLPVLVYSATKSMGFRSWVLRAGAAAALVFVLFTRSRGAWVAVLGAAAVCGAITTWRHKSLRWLSGRTLFPIISIGVLGIFSALVFPNRLRWVEAAPYMKTANRLVDLSSLSARIRLRQQATTLRMLESHPLLGAGPGNWTIAYGRYASLDDPSYNRDAPVPTNRLPHGDLVGLGAEIGFAGIVIPLVALGFLLRQLSTQWRSQHFAVAAAGMLCAAGIIGLADPLLLTPAPAFMVALVLGVAAPRLTGRSVVIPEAAANLLPILFAITALQPAIYSARQVWAHSYFRDRPEKIAQWDPGDFGSRIMLAEQLRGAGQCALASKYAVEAFRLRPTSLAPGAIVGNCIRHELNTTSRTPKLPALPQSPR